MKPMNLCLALALVSLTLPCVAQTSETQGSIPPQLLQALQAIHSYSGPRTQTPQEKAYEKAVLARLNEMDHAGAEDLKGGDFTAAEGHFRESIIVSPSPEVYYKLGEALAGQGRVVEAIEAYRTGIYWPSHMIVTEGGRDQLNPLFQPNTTASESWMKYVLLLNQTGQGAEAVAIYKKALSQVPDVNRENNNIQAFLNAGTSSPVGLQAVTHIALGLCATFSGSGSDKAMSEFNMAWKLQPDSALTNYYYGYGWQRLDLKSRARVGSVQQARAALQKAVLLGKGDLKKAARKALRDFDKPVNQSANKPA